MTSTISGLNHLTLAVHDVSRSVSFYTEVLGCKLRAVWAEGAYLEAGGLWLCLSYDPTARTSPHPDYTHIAFTVAEDEFSTLAARLTASCPMWKDNRSEGASVYFLDPDGHKLEIHVGSLESRLDYYRAHPEKNVRVL
jgi:catechol 2,3-dioxygenase-like lactoylglutathione lyase family enzyme